MNDDDDEDLNFFRSIVPHIRDLSSYEKLSLRIKVLECIREFKHQNQQQQQTQTVKVNDSGVKKNNNSEKNENNKE